MIEYAVKTTSTVPGLDVSCGGITLSPSFTSTHACALFLEHGTFARTAEILYRDNPSAPWEVKYLWDRGTDDPPRRRLWTLTKPQQGES